MMSKKNKKNHGAHNQGHAAQAPKADAHQDAAAASEASTGISGKLESAKEWAQEKAAGAGEALGHAKEAMMKAGASAVESAKDLGATVAEKAESALESAKTATANLGEKLSEVRADIAEKFSSSTDADASAEKCEDKAEAAHDCNAPGHTPHKH